MLVRPRAGEAVELDQAALEAELADIVRNWHDDLRDALVAAHGEREGLALASRYGRALSTPYLPEAGTAVAVADVRHLPLLPGPHYLALRLSPLSVFSCTCVSFLVTLCGFLFFK